jgi:arylsulfatase A-like enzyme
VSNADVGTVGGKRPEIHSLPHHGFVFPDALRTQFTHVIDVSPTVLEAAGLPQPESVNGIRQDAIEGVSMTYSFDNADAPERHDTQYFEMFGNRGIYHKGWTAVTHHRTPWAPSSVKPPAFDDDVWELYSDEDWTQAEDLSPDYPADDNHFNGEVNGVLLSIEDDPDNSDHLIKPEDAVRAALGRQ